MAILNNYHTLVELAKRTKPDGNMAELINTLAEKNPMLEEAHWEQANDINSHQFVQVISEPMGSFGRINKDIPFSAARTKQVVEPIGSIVDALKVDERLLEKAPNASEYMAREAELHVSGMGKTAHRTLLYGSRAVEPDGIDGFMTRLSALGSNVINGGATGAATSSILVVKWGRDGAYLTYPRNFGKFLEEKGPDRVWVSEGQGASGGYWAQVATWAINMGLCIAKPKNVQRIANISAAGGQNGFNADLLVQALDSLDNTDGAVIYVPKAVYTQMNIALMNKTNTHYSREEEWGRPVLHFMGIPVKRCDQMLATETALV